MIKTFGSCQAVHSIVPEVFLHGNSQVRRGGVMKQVCCEPQAVSCALPCSLQGTQEICGHCCGCSCFSLLDSQSRLCSPLKCHSSDTAFGLISLVQTNRHPPWVLPVSKSPVLPSQPSSLMAPNSTPFLSSRISHPGPA